MKQKSNLIRLLKYFKPVMGLFLLDSFFAIVLSAVSILSPFLVQFIVNKAESHDTYWFFVGIGFLVTSLIVRMTSNAIVTKWGHWMGIKMEVNMRKEAINKMHKLTLSHFDSTETGTYISRVVTDLKDIPEFAHHAPEDFIISIVTGVGGFTYAFLQSWQIGLVLLFVFIVGLIGIYFIRIKWRTIWTNVRKANSEMSASVGYQVEGITEIKSYNQGSHEFKKFKISQNKYRNHFFKLYKFEAWFTVTNIFIMSLTSIVTLSIGGYYVVSNKIQLSQLFGLQAVAGVLNAPMQKFVSVYTMLSRGSSSVDRFFEFMDLPEEKISGSIIPGIFKGNIDFQNVTFSYKNAEGKKITVLKNFNLKIKAGQKVAIIGETGIGKSTILKLLLKYYDISSGKILIDGKSISEFEVGSYRRRIGYIQQEPVIFNETIYNNIIYGNTDAKEQDVVLASKNASIYDFILNTEKGFDTIVGPRGASLSGGQKQRIAIARAFASHSDLFLMDEATSALDNETELMIKKSTEKLMKNKTGIIVAHRLTTIKDVDRIIVLGKGGKILQEGTHKELSKVEGYYRNMHII